MSVVTFYSFKGGVGRSMALANVAERLYRDGLRVLIIDFDLEAPGLERYFAEVLPPGVTLDSVQARRGVMDMLYGYLELRRLSRPETTLPGEPPNAPRSLPTEPFEEFLQSVYPPREGGGCLSLMTAGARHDSLREYAEKVVSFDWADFYRRYDGELFFDWFRHEALQHADVVLIDSRTGITEMGGVCTYQLADVVVSFVAANRQNFEGALRMSRSLADEGLVHRGRRGRQLYQILVQSRLEINEGSQAKKFVEQFTAAVHKEFPPDASGQKTTLLEALIPYVPYFAFEEKVAIRETDHPFAELLTTPIHTLAAAMAKFAEPDSRLYLTYHSSAEQIARVAEAIYRECASDEQLQLRNLFERFVRVALPSENTTDTTMNVDLDAAGIALPKPLLDRLIERRIIVMVPNTSEVKLADDRLPGAWPRLQQWIADDRAFLAWRQRMSVSMAEWESTRDVDDLLSGTPLIEARRWRSRMAHALSSREIAYFEESEGAEQDRQRFAQTARADAQYRVAQTSDDLKARYSWRFAIATSAVALVATGAVVYWQVSTSSPDVRTTAIVAAASASLDPLEKALLLSSLTGTPEPEGVRFVTDEFGLLAVPRAELKMASTAPILGVAFSPDRSRVVTTADDGRVVLWNSDGTGTPVVLRGHTAAAWTPQFNRAGSLILTASQDQTARIWSVDGRALHVLRGHTGLISAVFSPDGSRVATGSTDGTSRIWDAQTGQEDRTLRLDGGRTSVDILDIAFSPDGSLVGVATSDGSAIIRRVDVPGLASTLNHGSRSRIVGIAFDRSGTRVATASEDQSARIWSLHERSTQITLKHPAAVRTAQFSDDGRYIVTAADRIARIWNAKGELVRTLEGHTGAIWIATFTPDSVSVLTASADGTARLWDVESGSYRELRASGGEVRVAAVSRDGSMILTGSTDGNARVWDAKPRERVDTLDWDNLTAYLRNSTTACLSDTQRVRLLGEPEADAAQNYAQCEQTYGRVAEHLPNPR